MFINGITKSEWKIATKITELCEQLKFLRMCKSSHVVPKGLVIMNKLKGTLNSHEAERLALKHSRQWLILCCKNTYSKLIFFQKNAVFPLPKLATEQLKIISTTKSRKLATKLNALKEKKWQLHTTADNNGSPIKGFDNKTDFRFSKNETNLLNKGPSYIPPSTKLSNNQLTQVRSELQSCFERCKIAHHKGEDINPADTINFLSNTKSLIENANDSHTLTRAQKLEVKVIKDLRKSENIAICKTDKTNRLIAIDPQQYKLQTTTALGELKPSRKIEPITLQQKFNKSLSKLANKYSSTLKDQLLSCKCTEPLPKLAYGLPKDHKPGEIKFRPIVSNKESACENLCIWLVKILSPLLSHVPTHLKSSTEFISKLPQSIEEGVEFGSLDVKNLYGSIPLTGTRNAPDIYTVVSDFIFQYKDETLLNEMCKEDIISVLKLCLEYDNIFCNGQYCKQEKGIPMGNNLAPTIAIIYMHYVEQKLATAVGSHLKLFLRYIDDIFFIVNKDFSAENLLEHANKVNDSIQFTLEKPNDSCALPFLDILVQYNPTLVTSLYIKPFNSEAIMNFHSSVPKDRKVNLLRSEIQRAERNSSNVTERERSKKRIVRKFQLNQYPQKFIDKYQVPNITPVANEDPITYLKVPFINEKTTQKIKRQLRDAGLQTKIRLVFQSQPPLHRLLQPKREIIHCVNNCAACLTSTKPGQCKSN